MKNKKIIVPLILCAAGLLLIFYKPLFALISPAKLEMKIQAAPVIMPAIYKVYADENALDGKYNLFKMLLTNNSNNTARNVEVTFKVPGYIDEWQVINKFPVILAGQSVIVNCYPNFPEKIIEKTTSTKQQVNIQVKGSNISTEEENFTVPMRGRNEFMYTNIPADEIRTNAEVFDNLNLLSCLVTPEDPIIKYLTQQIQEKVLKGETASVSNKEEEGVRFLLGVYNATLLSHMVYSGTSGVPVKADDVQSLVQSIRLPREVITGKTGLCIELSVLYASIMASAGMDPIIYLIPGHAYPGFRMNGKYYAIESTAIGGEGIGGISSAEDALKTGMKSLGEFMKAASMGDDRYILLDVRKCIKDGAEAIELKDDVYLRQRIDEIAKSFVPGQSPGYVSGQNDMAVNTGNADGGNQGGGGSGNGGGGVPSGFKTYSGAVNFGYPSNWNLQRSNIGFNALQHVILDPNNMAQIEVYNFNGVNNAAQALNNISQFVQQNGGMVQYQSSGNSGGYSVYTGQSSFQSGSSIIWTAAFKNTGNGVTGIIVGASTNAGGQYNAVFNQILNTLK